MLRAPRGRRGITVQGGGVGGTGTGGAVLLGGRAAVIEAGTAADLVGVPGGRGGVEVGGGVGHRAGEGGSGGRGQVSAAISWMVSAIAAAVRRAA